MQDIVRLVLEDITESLIKYIYHFYNDPKVNQRELDRLKQEANPFFEMIEEHQDSVWSALGTLLRDQIDEIKDGENDFKIEAIDLIMCALNDLFPDSKQLE